jgi:hypothetical protein
MPADIYTINAANALVRNYYDLVKEQLTTNGGNQLSPGYLAIKCQVPASQNLSYQYVNNIIGSWHLSCYELELHQITPDTWEIEFVYEEHDTISSIIAMIEEIQSDEFADATESDQAPHTTG